MSETENTPEISCDNCIAACCRAGAALMMTHDERYKNKRTMDMQVVAKPRDYPHQVNVYQEVIDENGKRKRKPVAMKIPARRGLYVLLKDCGNLDAQNQCAVYDTRPEACANYEVGSQECRDARAVFGLDGNEAQLPLSTTETN